MGGGIGRQGNRPPICLKVLFIRRKVGAAVAPGRTPAHKKKMFGIKEKKKKKREKET